ncbi:hypothetical protein COL516b_001990 [Colletotrichum fioriniae]|nr:uncharacterized protein COL516b_001990 [Colletotrichum fioriniae]KAJ0311283.1 hypothetical protein COL516b_001990 [Colletotrichum fioriniae]
MRASIVRRAMLSPASERGFWPKIRHQEEAGGRHDVSAEGTLRKAISLLHFARLRHSDDLQNGNDQVGDDYLEDPLADLGDPGLFASTGPEENIDFHTSFEGMLLISQGLGPMALPEIGQADNFSNDSGFQGGITNAASPLTHGPATGDTAMEVFYTVKGSSSSPTETLLAVTPLDKTWRT